MRRLVVLITAMAEIIAMVGAGLTGLGALSVSAGTLPEERMEDQLLGGEVNEVTFSEYFGIGLDLDGDQMLVGAMGRNDPPRNNVGAVYDYRLDPATGMWTLHDLLMPPDLVSNDAFGSGVSRSGDYAIIGASGRGVWQFGSVFIYRYDAAADAWVMEQEIPHPGSLDNTPVGECPAPRELARHSGFGFGVSISRDRALVTAPFEDLCFLRSDLTPPTTHPGHCAEQDQDKDDCRLVDWSNKQWVGTDAGAAYFFRRNAATGIWELEQRVEPTGLALEAVEGEEPSIAKNLQANEYTSLNWGVRDGTLDLDAEFLQGALAVIGGESKERAWLYRFRADLQSWVELNQSPIRSPSTPPPSQNDDDPICRCSFGASVSMNAAWMAIGAPLDDLPSGEPEGRDVGAVYFYRWNALFGSWFYEGQTIGPVRPLDPSEADRFGRDVELIGDTLVVGSLPHVMTFFELDGGNEREDPGPGAAWVFDVARTSPFSVTERYKLQASDGVEKDSFGASLAYSDGAVAVAATGREVATGGVYTFDLVAPVAGELPVPEPAQGLMALVATAALALVRRAGRRPGR